MKDSIAGKILIGEMLHRRRANRLLVRLLRMLVRCSGIATTEEVAAILDQVCEMNDSVEIIARHVKREADGEASLASGPTA